MKDSQQLGLADHLLNTRRKQSKMLSKLSNIEDLVDWKQMEPDPWDRWIYETSNKSKNSENLCYKAGLWALSWL